MSDADTLTIERPAHEPLLADVKPDVKALTPAERQAWRETGEWPVTLESSTDAASSPAEPAAQAASTDASSSPASEPGTPKKANAETRIKELLGKVADLEGQLKARPSAPRPAPVPDAPAVSSTAAEAPSLAALIDRPDPSRPPLALTAFYEQYPEATVEDRERYVARYEIARDRATTAVEQDTRTVLDRFNADIDQAVKADPLFAKKLDALQAPVSLLSPGVKPGPLNYASEEILRSSCPAALVAHVTDHPEVLQGIRTEADAIRTMTRLAVLLEPAAEEVASVNPQPVSVTAAPAQPAKLSGKTAAPVDELETAVKNRDVRAYNRIMNSREAKR